jgi:hypothetical protein
MEEAEVWHQARMKGVDRWPWVAKDDLNFSCFPYPVEYVWPDGAREDVVHESDLKLAKKYGGVTVGRTWYPFSELPKVKIGRSFRTKPR